MSKEQALENKLLTAVKKRFEKVKASYQLYHNNPYKAEYIHQFRVDMRKTRALLNFLKPVLNEEIYDTFNQSLRELGHKLSPLRDLDTLIEKCSRVAQAEPDLIDNYADVFRFLEKERLKLVKQQSTKKAFEEFEGVLEGTEAILDGLTFHLDDAKEDELEAYVENRYQHKIDKFKKNYNQLDVTDYEAVHDVRKQAKKVRYTSAGFKKVVSRKERKTVEKEAKKAQTRLGEITDAHVSIEILEEYKEKAPNDQLQKAFEKILAYHKEGAPTQGS